MRPSGEWRHIYSRAWDTPAEAVIEGAAIGAAIGGFPGAVWADRDDDGYVDGYVYADQYYRGAPPGYDPAVRAVIGSVLGGASLGAAAGTIVPGLSILEGAVIGAAVDGLGGAVWADRNNDGRVDGYIYNGQYYQGSPAAAYAAHGDIDDCRGVKKLSLSPPQPSAAPLTVADRRLRTRRTSLLEAADWLSGALRASGYEEQSFYCVPGGFALATGIERIRDDDKRSWPGDGRWKVGRAPLVDTSDGISLGEIARALTSADPGTYRMILFFVTDKPISVASRTPGRNFVGLPRGGPDELPSEFHRISYGPNHRVKALVYEFKRKSVASAPEFVTTTLPTGTHLTRSGIIRHLGN